MHIALSVLKAEAETRFGYASAERIETRWRAHFIDNSMTMRYTMRWKFVKT
jgi:hypothetical protein